MQTKAEYLRAWRAKNPQKIEQYKENKRVRDGLKYLEQWKESNQDKVERKRETDLKMSEYQKTFRENKKRKDVINGESKGGKQK